MKTTEEGWPEGAWGVVWDRANGVLVQTWFPREDMTTLFDLFLDLMTENDDA